MGSREDLHTVLLALCSHVYYQPPENEMMEYPCIRYKRDVIFKDHANNETYSDKTRYQVTVMDRNPDSSIVLGVSGLQYCRHTQNFAVDGLNHDVFELYY